MHSHHHHNDAPIEDAQYIFLESPVSAERRRRLLGSVVPHDHATNPFGHYRPNLDDGEFPDQSKNEWIRLIDKLSGGEEEAVELTDLTTTRLGARSTSAAAKLSNIMTSYASHATSQEAKIVAGKTRRYTLDNPGSNLQDNLWLNLFWKSQLEKLVNDYVRAGKAIPVFCFVTGIWVWSDIEVSWKRERDVSVGASASVDVENVVTGNPTPLTTGQLKAGFEVDHSRSTEHDVFARSKKEVIFAVAYHVLEMDYEDINTKTSTTSNASGPTTRFFQRFGIGRKNQMARRGPGAAVRIKSVWFGQQIRGDGVNTYADGSGSSDSGLGDPEEEEEEGKQTAKVNDEDSEKGGDNDGLEAGGQDQGGRNEKVDGDEEQRRLNIDSMAPKYKRIDELASRYGAPGRVNGNGHVNGSLANGHERGLRRYVTLPGEPNGKAH